MSRLESDFPIRYSATETTQTQFPIQKTEQPTKESFVGPVLPFELRQEALKNFDAETRFSAPPATNQDTNSELHEVLMNAKRLQDSGEVQLAKNLFRSVLRVDGKNELAIRGLASCCRTLKQEEEAIQILRQMATQYNSAENHLQLADVLYDNNYNQEAMQHYLRAVPQLAENSDRLFHVYKNVGNLHLRLGDSAGAEENYNKAYTINPDSDALRVNFGSLALFMGDMEKALTRFREAVQLNDKNDKAWAGLAIIHREYGDAELAWANIEKALDLQPDNDSAIRLVCDWAMKDNEVDKAIFRLQRFLDQKPEDVFLSMMLAKFLYFAGDLTSALVEAEKALCLDPEYEEAAQVLDIVKDELIKRKNTLSPNR